jgi:hypothetical protein
MGIPFIQNSWSAGETDPSLRQRADVKVFYTSFASASNVLPKPQAGFRLRGGMAHINRARRVLERLPTADFLLAPTSPIASGAIGGLLTGAGCVFAAQGAASWLFTLDLQVTVTIVAIDLLSFLAATGGLGHLIIQTSLNGSNWTEWARRDLRPSINTRRAALQPGQSRHVRFIRVGTVGAFSDLTIGQIQVWRATTAKSAVRIFRHQVGNDAWKMVLTEFNIDLYKNLVWTASARSPYTAAQLPAVTSAHDPGGALLFHRDVPVQFVQPRGFDVEWNTEDYAFSGIPTRIFDDTGATEAIISPSRGYPACGCFWNQRLVIGGLRSVPQAILLSVQGSPRNLDTSGTLATDGILVDLVGDEQGIPIVRRLRAGPFLEVFTQLGFFFSAERVAAKGQGFGFILSERTPIREATRVVEASNLAYFIEDGAAVIRQLAFDESTAERYTTTEISVFNAHLVKGANQLAARPARTTQGCTLLSVVRDDGGWGIGSLLPSQQLIGFTPQDVGGPVLATAAIGGMQDIVLAVDRGADVHLEWLDDSAMLDMSVRKPCQPVLTGLDHLEGRSDVWIRSDQGVFGPLTVSSGQLVTELVATGTCEVGVPFQWYAHQQRLAGDAQRQIAFSRTISVGVVRLELDAAVSFDVAVDDSEPRTIDLPARPDALDPTLADRVFKGTLEEDGFLGLPNGKVKLSGHSVWPFDIVSILREATW